MGRDFEGIYDILNQQVVFYQPTERGRRNETVVIDDLESEALDKLIGDSAAEKLREDLELLEVLDPFDEELFLAGKQTPVFFGSAINNFGVKDLLAAFVRRHLHNPVRR